MTQTNLTGSSTRLEERVYGELLDAIRFGRFALGQRLPSENELAQKHGVSRPVVRMALSRLREDGLIVSKQGAGSFVSTGSAASDSGYAPLSSVEDIGAYFSFRRLIEAESAQLAARHANSGDVEALQACADRIETFGELNVESIDPDIEFHQRIAKLSNNYFLVDTIKMFRVHMIYVGRFARSLHKTNPGHAAQARHSEHQGIIDAIAKRDEALAKAEMIAHIERSERRVFRGA